MTYKPLIEKLQVGDHISGRAIVEGNIVEKKEYPDGTIYFMIKVKGGTLCIPAEHVLERITK